MTTPIVALVGRPNVGKSSLFNRLVGKPLALVHDEPGVTRDRHYADAFSRGRAYVLVDTGGFDPESDDPMRQRIIGQVNLAVAEADVIVCVLDASTGATAADREAIAMLRRSVKPVIYVANKADTPRIAAESGDLYRLGVPEIVPISALHGRGIAELEEALVAALPSAPPEPADQVERADGVERADRDEPAHEVEPADRVGETEGAHAMATGRGTRGRGRAGSRRGAEDGEPDEDHQPGRDHERENTSPIPRVAIIGRPNAGKSSLVNRLLGAERMLVDDRPGTTRDAIDAVVERDDKKLVIVDTAGIRRKARVAKEDDPLEGASVLQAIRALEHSNLALLVCDAAAGVSEQDAKILGLAVDRGRAVVIALNKIDLLDDKTRRALDPTAREKLSFVPWAPIVPISALSGRGMNVLLQTVERVYGEFRKRVPTGELNRFFEQALLTRPPPTMSGRAPRLFYITQAETAPPLFVVMTNEPDHIHFSYRRFIVNQLRKSFGFEGVPIRVVYKKRRRR